MQGHFFCSPHWNWNLNPTNITIYTICINLINMQLQHLIQEATSRLSPKLTRYKANQDKCDSKSSASDQPGQNQANHTITTILSPPRVTCVPEYLSTWAPVYLSTSIIVIVIKKPFWSPSKLQNIESKLRLNYFQEWSSRDPMYRNTYVSLQLGDR